MRIDIFSIFPDYLEGPLSLSLIQRARDAGRLDLRLHDLRAHATDPHRTVDDAPFGGGLVRRSTIRRALRPNRFSVRSR